MAASADTVSSVTTKPGLCPFEKRQFHTQEKTVKGEFRVVSYNILADIWAQRDYATDFSYCPPHAFTLAYRQQLVIKELEGYNGDVICLQEVDTKVYHDSLLMAMEVLGFHGTYKQKAGEHTEGSAIFFRKTKFRLAAEYGEFLKDVLESSGLCDDILLKTDAVPVLKQVLQDKTQVVHVLVLESVDQPGRLILVANTHLFWHVAGEHVRLVQILVAMRYVENLLQKYKKQNPSLVFCGDFNSTPDQGVYEFMTTRTIKEDSLHLKDGGPDQFVSGMNFSHSLNLDSGCGKLPYTNYTADYKMHLDYIYYDLDLLQVSNAIPPPEHEDVELHTGLPSIVFPSDHIAQICDFKWK